MCTINNKQKQMHQNQIQMYVTVLTKVQNKMRKMYLKTIYLFWNKINHLCTISILSQLRVTQTSNFSLTFHKFNQIVQRNTQILEGGLLSSALKSIKKISGADHNCHFWEISFAISGSEEYHENVRNMLCNFISLFYYQLSLFLSEGEGEGYLKSTTMWKSGTWATETEILVTAKMFHKDVYTWYKGQWLQYSYYREPTKDAIYLNNQSTCHFDVVLSPWNRNVIECQYLYTLVL